MGQCEICGTGTQAGRHIRHKAAGRWELKAPKKPRRWAVNVQRKRVRLNGRYRRMRVCTRCLRTLDKQS